MNIGTPIDVPSTTIATRPRRVGMRPAIAAGSTPTASASPRERSLTMTTAPGSAYIAPSPAADRSQTKPGGRTRRASPPRHRSSL